VRAARDLRVGLGLTPNERVEAILRTADPDRARILETIAPLTQSLAGISEIQINAAPAADRKYMSAVAEGVEIFMPVDEERTRVEIERLKKKRAQLTADGEKISRKLDNPDFISRAPEAVVSKERDKYNIIKADIETVEQRLHALSDG
jgi:valyl-tRNA synthetase